LGQGRGLRGDERAGKEEEAAVVTWGCSLERGYRASDTPKEEAEEGKRVVSIRII